MLGRQDATRSVLFEVRGLAVSCRTLRLSCSESEPRKARLILPQNGRPSHGEEILIRSADYALMYVHNWCRGAEDALQRSPVLKHTLSAVDSGSSTPQGSTPIEPNGCGFTTRVVLRPVAPDASRGARPVRGRLSDVIPCLLELPSSMPAGGQSLSSIPFSGRARKPAFWISSQGQGRR